MTRQERLDQQKKRILKEFEDTRTRKDYAHLGWLFWHAFGTLDEGEVRNFYSELWNSLPEEEKKLCENT